MSFTNQAIDNVLLRLKEKGIPFVRISNNPASVDTALHAHVRSASKFSSFDEITSLFARERIFAGTCLAAQNQIVMCANRFDYCVMDEASQINEPISLGPLLLAERFIMIGDYHQLNPIAKSFKAEQKGMSVSLF